MSPRSPSLSASLATRAADLGEASYDNHDFGAEWWRARATSWPHRRAYQRIAEMVAALVPADATVIDYACGPALLLRSLVMAMPRAQLIGIDESQDCLDAGHKILQAAPLGSWRDHITLRQAVLPDFSLDLPPADLVVFSFPDFRCDDDDRAARHWRQARPDDWQAIKQARRRLTKTFDGVTFDSSANLMLKRVAHRHMHSLLKPGGYFIRIDYANCNRTDCDPGLLAQMEVYEGSTSDDGEEPVLQLISDSYHRSQVMRDVAAQTGNPADGTGGFMISVLKKT